MGPGILKSNGSQIKSQVLQPQDQSVLRLRGIVKVHQYCFHLVMLIESLKPGRTLFTGTHIVHIASPLRVNQIQLHQFLPATLHYPLDCVVAMEAGHSRGSAPYSLNFAGWLNR